MSEIGVLFKELEYVSFQFTFSIASNVMVTCVILHEFVSIMLENDNYVCVTSRL